jgi:hypothetical protein
MYILWDGSNLDLNFFFLAMGQSKMPITKDSKLNFGCPHN